MATEQDWDDFFSEMKDYVKSRFEEGSGPKDEKETAPSPGKKEDTPEPPKPPTDKEAPTKKPRRWGFFPEES